MINWNWKPLISIGPFKFGQVAKPLIKKYNLIALELDCESADWDTYEFPDSQTRIYVENLCINSVGCYDNLLYKGTNLLGLSLSEVRQILGNESEIGEVIEMQTPVEYETLGLQLWLEDKIVVGGICYGLIEA